jgi:hypothetical protein
MKTLCSNSLQELAMQEYFNVKAFGLFNNMSFKEFIKTTNGCIYGFVDKMISGKCDPNSVYALKTIQKTCQFVTSNTFDGFGKVLPVSYVDQFIDHYGRVLIHRDQKQSLIVNTEMRVLYFLTPLENFMRFPENETGYRNMEFVSNLLAT